MEELQQNEQALTKQEQYQLKKEQKQEEHKLEQHKQTKKKIIKIIIAVIIVGAIILALIWGLSSKVSSMPKSETISKQGLHWHANLSIKILGEYQDISGDVGIGVTHNPIHTHESDGIIHMEFSGLVKENNLKLGSFFKTWKKTFSKDCILDKCNGDEGQVKMFVNDEQNFEFENYIMGDKNKIEIIFE